MKDKAGSRNIGKALPSAPDNSDAGVAIILSSEKAAELCNPKGSLCDGGYVIRNMVGFMVKSIKSVPFMVSQNKGTRSIGLMAADIS